MKTSRSELLNQLKERVQFIIDTIEPYQELSDEILNAKETPEKWSILECLEHLNLYGDFYLKELEEKMLAAKPNAAATTFKSGWLGNYFATSILPNEDGTLKSTMKTFKDKDPVNVCSNLSRTVLQRFFKQQDRFLELLKLAAQYDLTKVRTRITILQSIKLLRLGDTFRFAINHEYRHIFQAERARQAALELVNEVA